MTDFRARFSQCSGPLALVLVMPLFGCADEPAATEQHEDFAVRIDNGLPAANGLGTDNGLNATNGLGSNNGLVTTNGLITTNGLSSTSGLMASAGGRNLVSYLVRCALVPGQTLSKADPTGNVYTFVGEIGLAPYFAAGACDDSCQEKVTACLMALTNADNRHVSLELVSAANELSLRLGGTSGDDVGFPNQEGAVFGNLFVTPPKMFTCTGTEADRAPQVKRRCIAGPNCPLFTSVGSCAFRCGQTCTKGSGGKNVCSASVCFDPSGKLWTNPITIYLPNKMQANSGDDQAGVRTFGDAIGGISSIENGGWVRMNDVQFGTIPGPMSLAADLASQSDGGFIDARMDSLVGPLLGTITTTATITPGGPGGFAVQRSPTRSSSPTGAHTVFFQFHAAQPLGPSPVPINAIRSFEILK